MEEQKNNKPIAVVSLAVVAVMAILVLVFLLRPSSDKQGILLPDPQQDAIAEQRPQTSVETEFLELTTENVLQVLQSLNSPGYYHQKFEVVLNTGRRSMTKQVDVWVNDGLLHGEIRTGNQLKSLLTDGNTAWIWYDSDLNPVAVELNPTVTMEDLIGLPAFDFLRTLAEGNIVDAAYEQETNEKYVFVCTQEEARADRYWIDLQTGLLNRYDVLENSEQIYTVTQTDFDRLAPGDQAFAGRFCLPDGTEPFTVERQMLQP